MLASRAGWLGQSSSYIGLQAGLIPPLDAQNVGGGVQLLRRLLLNNMAPPPWWPVTQDVHIDASLTTLTQINR